MNDGVRRKRVVKSVKKVYGSCMALKKHGRVSRFRSAVTMTLMMTLMLFAVLIIPQTVYASGLDTINGVDVSLNYTLTISDSSKLHPNEVYEGDIVDIQITLEKALSTIVSFSDIKIAVVGGGFERTAEQAVTFSGNTVEVTFSKLVYEGGSKDLMLHIYGNCILSDGRTVKTEGYKTLVIRQCVVDTGSTSPIPPSGSEIGRAHV